MTELDLLADELAVSGRTLRRAAARGLIHCEQPSSKRIRLPAHERKYIRNHWPLLGRLLALLRTEPNVRLAVLFGSLARGDASVGSDADLLVRFAGPPGLESARLSLSLSERLGRGVQIVSLEAAERTPLLLADVLRDGRVLVDRDGEWPGLRRRERAIQRRARADGEKLEQDARRALESLAS